MSSPEKQPKVLLFDMGGVCVASPFQSILDYELSHGIPPGWVNYSISKSAPDGFWQRLERGEIPLDATFFAGFNRDLHDPARWAAFCAAGAQSSRKDIDASQQKPPPPPPPMPQIDGEWLFHDMMRAAQAPDPWMFPALRNLRSRGGRYVLATLSNTVLFPPGHELARDVSGKDPLRSLFDVFVSSAHVGLRKPDPRIYALALREVDAFARSHADSPRGRSGGWGDGVRAEDVVFLDDIGENLKAARQAGFRTIKVPLGRAYEAVEELERITGLQLAGDHPKVPVQSKALSGRAKM